MSYNRQRQQYWMETCPIHHHTLHGEFWRTQKQLDRGCLKCWFVVLDAQYGHSQEDCLSCPPAGAPYSSELANDHE